MTLTVDPDGLRAAAGRVAELSPAIDAAPALAAAPESSRLVGAKVGAALADCDPSSRQAKDVVKSRFDLYSSLLAQSADAYDGSDLEIAQRLSQVENLTGGGR